MVNMRSLCVLIATCGAALGDIVVSRTVEKFPGTASAVIEGDACGTNDQWGSNNCDLDWSSTYVADLSIATGTDIVEGSTITIGKHARAQRWMIVRPSHALTFRALYGQMP